MKPNSETALRDFLFAIAIIAAVIAGGALLSLLGLLTQSTPMNLQMIAPTGIALAIIAASMWIRSIIQPRFHHERVKARSEKWVDWATIVIFVFTSMVTIAGAAIFHWPAWLAALVAASMLVIGLLAVARHAGRTKTESDGRCPTCGYDTRGLPEPRCPECGTPLDPEANATDQ